MGAHVVCDAPRDLSFIEALGSVAREIAQGRCKIWITHAVAKAFATKLSMTETVLAEGMGAVADAVKLTTRIHRDPTPTGYRTLLDLPATAPLAPTAAPALAVTLAELDLR